MILVVGASSTLGSRVTTLDRGLEVRATSRDPGAKLAGLAADGVDVVSGDLRDRASLDRALVGAETVLACAHGLLPLDRRNTILNVDKDGNSTLIDAARAAGVGHFVLMSISIASPTAPCMLGRAKAAAEGYLRASGIPATAIRPTAFMEAHVLGMFGEPLRSTGKVRIFGRGQTKMNFVAADDVADVVAGAIADEPADGLRLVDIGGPEDMTRTESIDLLEAALGVKARRSHVPVSMMKVMRVVARPFNPSLSYVVDTALMEETHPELLRYMPGEGRLVGATRLQAVVEAWAGVSS
jgi:NADH dehydrogenase